jgi:hypothetical protein
MLNFGNITKGSINFHSRHELLNARWRSRWRAEGGNFIFQVTCGPTGPEGAEKPHYW